ncbi:hypothetical protein DPMN_131477 [Dreissena polymorpha]|uniref:Uncharacterized protein n=1 Tax=Dreissena polymorpha TaxID=45954 RepID=A0A9D4H9M1_DREPO|nr:hypothetical protein DPMN_131477 [Dreissena polymorpha]
MVSLCRYWSAHDGVGERSSNSGEHLQTSQGVGPVHRLLAPQDRLVVSVGE